MASNSVRRRGFHLRARVHRLHLHVIYRWCGYACWCVLRRFLFQNMAYRRLRQGLGPSWTTSSIAGALFAAAHIPNPILVPATFLWGTVSTRMFKARPSVPVLGVTQALLSAMLYVATPVALNGQFRVGLDIGPRCTRHNSRQFSSDRFSKA